MKSSESGPTPRSSIPMGIILGDIGLVGGTVAVIGSILTKNAGSTDYLNVIMRDFSEFGYVAIALITTSSYISGRLIDWIRK